MPPPLKLKIFKALLEEVIHRNLCEGCGACIAACPVSAIDMWHETPTLVSKCILCEFCYYSCPKTETSIEDIEKKIFGRTRKPEEAIGIYLNCYSARSKKEEILKVAQDGGIVTSLLAYALQERVADAAVTSGVSVKEPWKPVPKVALSFKELLESAGTRYSVSSILVGLMSAVEEYAKNKIAIVGTPCQIIALRKMETSPHGVLKLAEKVSLVLGLFCMESFYYDELISKYIQKKKGVDINKVSKFLISKGKFIVRAGGQDAINVPLDEVKMYARLSCHTCTDFTSELADISVGSVGSPEGWSTVIIRTERGKKIFEDAVKAGFIEYKPIEQVKPGLNLAVKLSKIKRQSAQEVLTEMSASMPIQ
jgi:coenzyme F420 hydrogenase subunit beta